MNNNNRIIIGCDIGGVVKNQSNDLPIFNAIESLKKLEENYKIIFISKCKDSYRLKTQEWLKKYQLDKFDTFYCLDCKDKIGIAIEQNVTIMIDDKIQVLSHFNRNDVDILKIWLCDEEKKIAGTRKFQPELFASLRLATNWNEVTEIINTI